MTLLNKKGPVNVVKALTYVLSGQLPAAVAAHNAANSVSFMSYLAESFVLSVDKTLILSLDKATAVTVTVAAGTYTATQLATALNNDAGFSGGGLTAATRMDDKYLEVHATARGSAGSVKLGEGTINSILGLANNRVWNWNPLRDIAQFDVVTESIDRGIVTAYPALIFRMPDSIDTFSEGGGIRMVEYAVEARLYWVTSDHSFKDTLFFQLGHMNELINTVLRDTDNVSLCGQVNSHSKDMAVRYSSDVEATTGFARSWFDFVLTVSVQEDN